MAESQDRASALAEELLIRHWTMQLYLEYENIVYQRRVALKAPFLRIAPMSGTWGRWESFTRTITLHPDLIRKHGWDITLEVLKHEMAHQMATDVFGAKTAHGRPFQLACKHLNVAEWAATASGELPKEIPTDQNRLMTEDEEKMLKRVEKLLSLATSSNEHEALLAMQRVQEIYARYNLERLRDARASTYTRVVIPLHKKRVERNISMICSILLSHFFVKVITRQVFDPQRLDTFCAVELLGTRENVQMAEYVFHFLQNQTGALYEANRKKLSKGRSTRSDFVLGVLDGFRKKLKLSQEEVLGRAAEGLEPAAGDTKRFNTTALIRQGDQELEDFVEQHHPRLTSRKANYSYGDRAAFAAGQAEGNRLVIHKGLNEDAKGQGRLLGSGKG